MRRADSPGAETSQLDETAHLLWAVSHAPQVVLQPGWCLDVKRDCWQLVTESGKPALRAPQFTLVGAGTALEHAVLALEARGHRVQVVVLPEQDPAVVATIEVLGAGPPRELAPLPGQPAVPVDGQVQPSDLRRLNLAAEAFGVEVLWSTHLTSSWGTAGLQRVRATAEPRPMATLISYDDDAAAQVNAGRALAHVLLRAAALGLEAHLGLHVLSQRETRDELRRLWGLAGHPQAQFTLGAVPDDQSSAG